MKFVGHIPRFAFVLIAAAAAIEAQPGITTCATSAVPPIVRAEGLTERVGDISYACTGQPGAVLTVNLAVSLNVNVTNRLSAANTLTGIILTVDSGSGPQALAVTPVLTNASIISFNDVTFALAPGTGKATLNIADIRGNATQVPLGGAIIATLGLNGPLLLTNSFLVVGTPQTSLYSSMSSSLSCAQSGATVPSSNSFAAFIAAGAVFSSTRVTEGFADSLQPPSGWANLNADSGSRIIVRYSGFPSGAQLFVPDVVAGSDAVQPTAGGDYGYPASGGAYVNTKTSLLLARVNGADSNGAGGTPVFNPASSSGTVHFDNLSALTLTNGAAYVVYEVVDADPAAIETAQFPTFLAYPPITNGVAPVTAESVTLAPVSTVSIATTSDPIPRFIAMTPPPDCSIVGDCSASYQPHLYIRDEAPLQFSASGTGFDYSYVSINNTGGGVMTWNVTAVYPSGAPNGWLVLNPNHGTNDLTIRVDALATGMQPGTYQALLVIDAGPLAGSETIPVTFTVGTPPPSVQVTSVVNSASLTASAVVPGSLFTVFGSPFSGKSVSVTFDGEPAQILFSNSNQINLMVPPNLAAATSKMVVNVDSLSSTPMTVNVTQFSPAIFKGAVLNEDWTVNSTTNRAAPGSVIMLYATGLSVKGTVVTAKIGGQTVTPYYAGPAPGYSGVQQINLPVPAAVTGVTTDVFLCASSAVSPSSQVCGVASPLAVK